MQFHNKKERIGPRVENSDVRVINLYSLNFFVLLLTIIINELKKLISIKAKVQRISRIKISLVKDINKIEKNSEVFIKLPKLL